MSPSNLVHGCYFPSWSSKCGAVPSSMNLSIITHIFYAFAKVTPNGIIGHIDEAADIETLTDGEAGGIRACISLKRCHPVKVLISIGGGNHSGPLMKVASSERGRKKFSRSVKMFVEKYGFDGVDLDWEHIDSHEAGQNYVLLLQSLRENLPGYQLTSALTAAEWSLRNIVILEAARSLDFINLMCYDFAGPWSELSGHHAQLYVPHTSNDANLQASCDSAVQYLLNKHISPSKIVMGIPTYGRSFAGTDNTGQKATGHNEFSYRDLPRPGSVEFTNIDAGAGGCVDKLHGFITYDTPATVAMKAQYVMQNRLGGLFYWTGTYDAPPGSRSLMTTGYNAMIASPGKEPILEENRVTA